MLNWKNKPIDQLSKVELQQALVDATATLLETNGKSDSSDIFTTFILGLAFGSIISITGMYIGSFV